MSYSVTERKGEQYQQVNDSIWFVLFVKIAQILH